MCPANITSPTSASLTGELGSDASSGMVETKSSSDPHPAAHDKSALPATAASPAQRSRVILDA
jgi:hypothetical protein